MRILGVRFKNLNSLIGEWAIDLTHPAFSSDGIFAITGPTGAGKTTILDAICLALYGRTPRLIRVNKSGNEIMSRQTGDCFAEITFETQGGNYRCHWSQHRGRKKANGELQLPRHELSHANSGEIIASSIRGVAQRVEAITGMDFDRFTRSMLLAQGGFAAFLQAAPDERAPILEQITGTEIYSHISVRVHERRIHENKTLKELQSELAGMQLLEPDAEQQLGASLEEKTTRDKVVSQRITDNSLAIRWIEDIARLEEALKQLDGQKASLQIRLEAFEPENQRLRLANQALELSGDYSTLTAIRDSQKKDLEIIGEFRESLPDREQAVAQATGVKRVATDQREVKRLEQEKAKPVIRKVQALDLKMVEKEIPIRTISQTIEENSASLKSQHKHLTDTRTELIGERTALEKLLLQLEATRADEGLVEHLAGVQVRFESLQTVHGKRIAKLEEIELADTQLQKVSKELEELSAALGREKNTLEVVQRSLDEKQGKVLEVLENRVLGDWRNDHSKLIWQKDRVSRAFEMARSRRNSKQVMDELKRRRGALIESASMGADQLNDQLEKQTGLEQEMELLETQLTLLQCIEDLEQARHQLQDGEPCPLCGAREHPFAEGNTPVPDETRQRLIAVRADLKSVTDAVSRLKVEYSGLIKDIEQVESSLKAHKESIEGAEREITRLCLELPPELKVSPDQPGLLDELERNQERIAQELEKISSKLDEAEMLENELSTLREALGETRDSVVSADRKFQAAIHNKQVAVQHVERLTKESEDYGNQQAEKLLQLQNEVQVYGLKPLSIDSLNEVLEQMTARREQWLERQGEKTRLAQNVATLDLQQRHGADQIQTLDDELGKQKKQRDALLRELEVLAGERKQLFGDKNPEDEEYRLSTATDVAARALEEADRTLVEVTQQWDEVKARIDQLKTALEERGLQLNTANEHFLSRCKATGFSDEQAYTYACLPENERRHLTLKSRELAEENAELTARERETGRLLDAQRQKQITKKTLDELRDTQLALVADQKGLQQEIGGICTKLNENENLKKEQHRRLEVIEAQRKECARWDLLHELIGSADGKKYRNFAQGLTFELVVGHANRQLQKMTDRYLLIRDDGQPLELNVVDNYQAGEIRSTKNLSGGESFIVSLSLALGLSHMTSRNVRVDSLFLDEGFGTLDEDALETALETLAGLQQEGKLIGVISHVPALKERISTQIQINPGTGGRSLIAGPGCCMKGG